MDKSIKGITIKVGGDTTGLDKALNDVNKTASSTERQLRDVDKALRFDPKNTTLLSEKQQLLAKDIEATRSKLDILRSAQAQVKEQYAKGEIDEGAYRSFQIELGKTEAELDDLKKKARDLGTDFTRSLDEAGTKAAELGDKLENAGKKVSAVSGAAAALGGAALVSAKELTDGYDIIVRKTGATGDALEDLKSISDQLFSSMAIDAGDAGTVVGEVNTRFGAVGDDLRQLSELFLQFSDINEIDLNSSVDQADSIMKQFGLDSSETANVLGLLTKTSQDTGIAADSLMSTVQKNGATFKELGLDLEGSVRLLAQFEKNGVNTDTALAGLKKSVMSAAEEGKDANEALAETIGAIRDAATETDALTAAQELFGTKGAAEMSLAIRERRLDLDDLSGSVRSYGSVVNDTYNATQHEWDRAKIAVNNLKTAGADLGQTILTMLSPLLDKLSDKIKALTSWFSGLTEEEQKTIVKVLGVVAAIGPLLIIMGQVSTGISGIIGLLSFLAANHVVAVIAVIGLLIGAMVTLYQTNEDFRRIVDDVWSSVDETVTGYIDDWKIGFESIIDFFTVSIPGALDSFAAYWKGVWKDITDGAKLLFYDFQVWYVNTMNDIIDGINMIGLDFSWMGIDQSVGFNLERYQMPSPPQLASGGVVSSGSAIIAEAGPELLTVMNGRAVVQPLSPTASNAPAAQAPESQTFVLMLPDYKVLASGTAKHQDAIAGETIQLKTRTRL